MFGVAMVERANKHDLDHGNHSECSLSLLLEPESSSPRVGARSLRAIAAELNRRGIQTPRGAGEWKAGTVSQLLART
jgi:hypothetical protein